VNVAMENTAVANAIRPGSKTEPKSSTLMQVWMPASITLPRTQAGEDLYRHSKSISHFRFADKG
jgi:hypothetical protein